MPPVPEFSAGGVVLDADPRTDPGRAPRCVVIVPTRRAADGQRVLALPKGHPDPGETALDGALREVREEAGVDAELIAELGDVRYFYMREGQRIAKVVRFFLMTATGGDVADHDHEVEDARWVSLEEAAATLSYAGEREMVRKALLHTQPNG
ncbi:MAG: hydrolase [Solirubrobacterales bacterium]|jgi:8-oxo-dGTP pyrophosphatase MutT (NUDIX family)|nr:hydrolase [Solirubrobacterales bacterium]